MPMRRAAWGKTDQETGAIHPLVHHSMDVAAVFSRMAELPSIRDRLEAASDSPLTGLACRRLAALVFLHDIGKLHPGFQAKGWPSGLWRAPLRGHLKEGWAFFLLAAKLPVHPFHKTMRQIMQWGEAVGPLVAAMMAHHGRSVVPPSDPTLHDWPRLQHYDWQAEAGIIDDALKRWFAEAFEIGGERLPNNPRLHHAVAGFAALADWIGSDTEFFPFTQPLCPYYDSIAHDAAVRTLTAIGVDIGAIVGPPAPEFGELTGFSKPNPAQAIVGTLGTDARLVILEAETGSGKTEAALWRFTQLLAAGSVSGLYFAVPTRAAARQLHGRVDRALRRVFGSAAPGAVLAIPGMLRAGEFEGQRLPDWRVRWDDEVTSAPQRWAAEHATRFLAAPVAVGTVDQAMLSGLQVKHAHLRGSALSRSLLVIDEVHASDAYMTEVLVRLLDGHLATGGYAMLMSATLGVRARVRWTGERLPGFKSASATPYPAVWRKGNAKPVVASVAARAKAVRTETVPSMDPTEAATRAILAAERGARVLVIRNTVSMSVATWRGVQEAGFGSLLMHVAGCPAVHHGRFAAEDRVLLDDAVGVALGPANQWKQRGCIVIGTQTLEQSLDIDADLLITDLCPVDVLLQRIGRLHRHDSLRPEGFETARALVLLPLGGLDRLTAPAYENGLGGWRTDDGGFEGIYCDLAGLELTRRLIDANPVWRIPEMNRLLVEGATHPDRIAAIVAEKGENWERYDSLNGGARAAEGMIAQLNVLNREVPFDELQFPSSDERIKTRLGDEGVVLKLDPPPIGPFGSPVGRIAVPARWSHGIAASDQVEITQDEFGLILAVANWRFRYSREGLSRESDH